jgi:hypothetical protein
VRGFFYFGVLTGVMSTDGDLLGIDDWGGLAVFGVHAVVALLLLAGGVSSFTGGQLPQGGLLSLIGLMILIVGRSAGRIVARR